MNAKKILKQAARKKQHKKEIERMTEAEAVDLLRNLTNKEDKKC